MKQYVAAVDQGTTSTRCILFDHEGRVCSLAQQEHRQLYPQAGWVEHDPLEIWRTTQEVIRAAVASAAAGPYGALDKAGNAFEWVAEWLPPGWTPSPKRCGQRPSVACMKPWPGLVMPHRHIHEGRPEKQAQL